MHEFTVLAVFALIAAVYLGVFFWAEKKYLQD